MPFLTPAETAELNEHLTSRIWFPLVGPQTAAYHCEADHLFYGGAAGGCKTDLLIGLALTQHRVSIIYRREGTQSFSIVERIAQILGGRDKYNGKDRVWRHDGRQIELGSCPHDGDEEAYQGRPHDLKGFDEITHFTETQFRFLCGWLRSPDPSVKQRVVCTGNPPRGSDGRWVLDYWAPWLRPAHPNPAKPGELRWFTTMAGKDVECEGPEPFKHNGKMVRPLSRTFIPSRVTDNVYLMETGYEAILQGLPEPLRSQMLNGDFLAGSKDNDFQVIPSEWVREAQARWKPQEKPGPMDSMGVDVARGGDDETSIACRHGDWYAELKTVPGKETPDGGTTAALVVGIRRHKSPVHIDLVGWGASAYDVLVENGIHTVGLNGASKTNEKDAATGELGFANDRARIHWRMREALDPRNDRKLALPPGEKLFEELTASRWSLTTGRGIQIELKENIIKRIGRSPNDGEAVQYALEQTAKRDESTGRIQFASEWR